MVSSGWSVSVTFLRDYDIFRALESDQSPERSAEALLQRYSGPGSTWSQTPSNLPLCVIHICLGIGILGKCGMEETQLFMESKLLIWYPFVKNTIPVVFQITQKSPCFWVKHTECVTYGFHSENKHLVEMNSIRVPFNKMLQIRSSRLMCVNPPACWGWPMKRGVGEGTAASCTIRQDKR